MANGNIVKHVNESEASLAQRDALLSVQRGRWMSAVWEVDGKGGVTMVRRTTWNFPMESADVAVGQLAASLAAEKIGAEVARPSPLPPRIVPPQFLRPVRELIPLKPVLKEAVEPTPDPAIDDLLGSIPFPGMPALKDDHEAGPVNDPDDMEP